MSLSRVDLLATGVTSSVVESCFAVWEKTTVSEKRWQTLRDLLIEAKAPFEAHRYVYHCCYPEATTKPAPAWWPDADRMTKAHVSALQQELHLADAASLHAWSATHRDTFWQVTTSRLGIDLQRPFNIANACFQAPPESVAMIESTADGRLVSITVAQLQRLVQRIANSINQLGLKKDDAVAIVMPMTSTACALYLAVVQAGLRAVPIAESFAFDEVKTRCHIANVRMLFTQDVIQRQEKTIAQYEKLKALPCEKIIVVTHFSAPSVVLNERDLYWDDFLVNDCAYIPENGSADDITTILFSSGTTGDPKAIPWYHTTALKCAADAYWHIDIHPGDVVCWPSNLGWMMGPWLLFAALINRATVALYHDVPMTRAFGEFVFAAQVSVLGVVPSMVKSWRQTECMQGSNWQSIKTFASSGEASNPDDMLYLMWLAGYRPIIEYCGGTEVGGAYISSTVVEPNVPSAFSMPAFGLDFILLDDNQQVSDSGEVALIPPSLGLSQSLLNRDHFQEYFAGMPLINGVQLRRHGDHLERFGAYFRALGRVDDTMNLSGIKTSSVAIERVINAMPNIDESAAIAVPPSGGGPSELVIYAVTNESDLQRLKKHMQEAIKTQLNPLFKIKEVVRVGKLPRTVSNKIMRRELRQLYKR